MIIIEDIEALDKFKGDWTVEKIKSYLDQLKTEELTELNPFTISCYMIAGREIPTHLMNADLEAFYEI